jgi:FkbM family methyltransferase
MKKYQYSPEGILTSFFSFYIRSIPNHPFKIRIINWVNDNIFQAKLIFKSNEGVKFYLSTKEYVQNHIISSGNYEILTINKCKAIIENYQGRSFNFIDIGSNFGLFSYSLGKYPNVNVVAVEPEANNFKKLVENFQLNKNTKIDFINLALSNNIGFSRFFKRRDGNDGTFMLLNENETSNQSYIVSINTFDNLAKYLGLTSIDLIKIDVEGAEFQVLQGINFDNNLKPKCIVLEYIDHNFENRKNQLDDIYTFLTSKGYKAKNVYDEDIKVANYNWPEGNVFFELD